LPQASPFFDRLRLEEQQHSQGREVSTYQRRLTGRGGWVQAERLPRGAKLTI
jgi:hypothetical protein